MSWKWTPSDSRVAFPKLYPARCSAERFHSNKFGKRYVLLSHLKMTVDVSVKGFDALWETGNPLTCLPSSPELI